MEKQLTGFPSIDKPWLKYYKDGAEERATNTPANKTVWDVIEKNCLSIKKFLQLNTLAVKYRGPSLLIWYILGRES